MAAMLGTSWKRTFMAGCGGALCVPDMVEMYREGLKTHI